MLLRFRKPASNDTCPAATQVIAQIETDKVVIDVKAPTAGVLSSLMAAPQHVVKPGQLIAVIDEKASSSGGSSAASSSGSSGSRPAAAAAAAAPAPAAHGRTPSIHFPPRVTPDGKRISALPAAQAVALNASLAHGSAAPAAPAAAATAAAAAPAPAKPAAAPAPKLVWVTRSAPRSVLTNRDMEMIDLGGAEPYVPKTKKKAE